MHASVEQAWPAVAREHEGVVHHPYLDSVGKVTVGIGLLIEADNHPTDECGGLPWTVDGQPATRAQIAAGWNAVNTHTDLAGNASAFEAVSRLRLDDQTINGALLAKTRQFWSELHSQLVDLERWPADAQLGLLDLAYQLGPWFMDLTNSDGSYKWPNFRAAAHSSDFLKASQHCSVKQASAERNNHRVRLFQNAAQVVFLNLDPTYLWDEIPPKEDDVTLSDADKTWIQTALAIQSAAEREWVSGALAKLKIPTKTDIAVEVLNSKTSDIVDVADERINIRPATALSEIHQAVKAKPLKGIGTATHLP